MSRSGYTDDDDNGRLNLWRGTVRSAIKGKRGQTTLREIVAVLDAMPVKALAAASLVTAEGEFCTLGALGAARGLDMAAIDPEDWDAVADALGIAPAMVREIVYLNDECGDRWDWNVHRSLAETPAERWARMRTWADRQITNDGKDAQ